MVVMEAWVSADESDTGPAATEPLDMFSLLSAVAAAATIAVNHPISQQIAQTASNELNKAQAVLSTWLDSLGKPSK